MTPSELYSFIKREFPCCHVESVCKTETTCSREGFCDNMQCHAAIDFDRVKDTFCSGRKGDVPASVDAVCVGEVGKYFCFVELKGWRRYIDNLSRQKRTISETAAKYNLSGKLADSQRLCMQIVDDEDLFAHMPVVFLLVTDISVDADGIGAFGEMLSYLSSSSTDVYSQCLTNAKRTLDSEIHINHYYIIYIVMILMTI